MRTGFFRLTAISWSAGRIRTRVHLDRSAPELSLPRPEAAKEDGSWSIWYNFDQYFYETEKGSEQAEASASSDGSGPPTADPNFMQYFFSAASEAEASSRAAPTISSDRLLLHRHQQPDAPGRCEPARS
jgi:hypothetical protein